MALVQVEREKERDKMAAMKHKEEKVTDTCTYCTLVTTVEPTLLWTQFLAPIQPL